MKSFRRVSHFNWRYVAIVAIAVIGVLFLLVIGSGNYENDNGRKSATLDILLVKQFVQIIGSKHKLEGLDEVAYPEVKEILNDLITEHKREFSAITIQPNGHILVKNTRYNYDIHFIPQEGKFTKWFCVLDSDNVPDKACKIFNETMKE